MSAGTSGHFVSALIRSLALAWKNLAAYPPGHPALTSSMQGAFECFARLRGPAGEVVLGVAADAILYGETRIDSTQAQKFAQALYSRGVAIIRFAGATTPADVEVFLRTLTFSPSGSVPLWEALTAAGVINIHLTPVDYSGVRMTEDLDAPSQKRESLWQDILRALVAGRELSPTSQRLLSSRIHTVDELSFMMLRYIETADQAEQFDADATFGVRSTAGPGKTARQLMARVAEAIGEHVGATGGLRRQLAVQQAAQLLRTMPEPLRGAIIKSIFRPLAQDENAGSELRELASSLKNDEVLEALRYLAVAGNLSNHGLTLLHSLAALDEKHQRLPDPPEELVRELARLFAEDDIDRYNPPDHQALLADFTLIVPQISLELVGSVEQLGTRVDTVAPEAVSYQLAGTVIELLAREGESRPADALLARAEIVFRDELSAGQYAEALDLVSSLSGLAASARGDTLRPAIEAALVRLGNTETIQTLIDSLNNAAPARAATIHRLLNGLGTVATRNLLLTLCEETNRSRRRRVFDLVCSLGPRIVPEVILFLKDDRWYVVRNMMVLLRSVNDRTSLPEIERLSRHPDLRVRLEAIKTLLASNTTVSRTLLEMAINDRDPKLAETAIALVGSYGIKEAVDPLLQIVAGRDVLGRRRPLRVKAIQALADLNEPRALPEMEHLFSTSFLPWPHHSERRAAFESLAAYPPLARAPFVERGLHSRDGGIRKICQRLSEARA